MSTAFSYRITSLRKEKGLSQKEVAMSLGVSQALLSHYEKGVRECGLDFVLRCADYFGVTTDYLLGKQDSKYGLINDELKFQLLEAVGNEKIDMQLVMLCISFFAEKVKRPVDAVFGDKMLWSSAIALYKLVVYSLNKGHLKPEWFKDSSIRYKDGVFQKIVDVVFGGLFLDETEIIGQAEEQYSKQFPEAFNYLFKSVEDYVEKIAEHYIDTALSHE